MALTNKRATTFWVRTRRIYEDGMRAAGKSYAFIDLPEKAKRAHMRWVESLGEYAAL